MFVCTRDQSYIIYNMTDLMRSMSHKVLQSQPTDNQPNQLNSTNLQANNLQIPMSGFLEN